MDLNIHNVVKIEVKPINDIKGSVRDFSIRELVIHSRDYNFDIHDYVDNKVEISCFLESRDVAKFSYSKE